MTGALLRLALAHGGPQPGAALPVRWVLDPLAIGALGAGASLYGIGVRRLWGRAGTGHGVRRWQAGCAAAGLAALVAAIVSPLDAISDVLLSAHMTQHELLMVVAAPLVVLGRPFVAIVWAFPPGGRRALGCFARTPAVSRTWHAVTDPLAVLVLHALALWTWHLPPLFEAALRHEPVHALQHAAFFWTAALFWWAVVHGAYGRAGYGVSLLYTFLTATHSSVLGALMTFARSVWYPTYAVRSAAIGASPLADQQLAGLIMWVPAGVAFLVAGLALLAAWIGESERRARAARTTRTEALP